jgi:hypothetical protein
VSGLQSENLEVVLTVKYGVPTFSSLPLPHLTFVTLFVQPLFVPMINFQQDLIVELSLAASLHSGTSGHVQ